MGNFELDDLLRGWKEIESFLRLSRKAIRKSGYPVHRETGSRNPGRSPVFAFKSELAHHMSQKQEICKAQERK